VRGAGGQADQGHAGAQSHDGEVPPRAQQAFERNRRFIVDYNRITVASPQSDAFRRDPVNLIRIFWLAQKYNLAFIPTRYARSRVRSI